VHSAFGYCYIVQRLRHIRRAGEGILQPHISRPLMSIQPDCSSEDLDRTDELPVLDVAAYEARVAEEQKGLSRTDAWSVDPLRDMDELSESAQQHKQGSSRKEGIDAGALTANVERILKRIAELEAEITAAHEANAALQKRSKALEADRDREAQRARSIEAENARLCEHRVLAEEMVARGERELREQSQRAEAAFNELQSSSRAERLRSHREHEDLRRQIDRTAAETAALQEQNRELHDQLQASVALAAQRANSIASLEKSLVEEKTGNVELARQLAAKLKDSELLGSVVDARNHTIDDLVQARDDLAYRLQQESASNADLTSQLIAAQQALDASRAILLGRENAIEEKDRQVAQLTQDLERITGELALAQRQSDEASRNLAALDSAHAQSLNELTERRREVAALRASLEAAEVREAAAQQELSEAMRATDDEEQRSLELEERLQKAQQTIVALGNERDAALTHIRSMTDEREALLPASTQLAARTAELEQKGMELAQALSELAAARAEVQSRAQRLDEMAEELAGQRAKFADQATATGELEDAIRARDELAEGLIAQVQAARDQQAAMSGQLNKLRARVKSLTQQIFSRDNEIAELQADLAVHAEALNAIRRDVNRIGGDSTDVEAPEDVEHVLEPIEHSGEPILLNGRSFTVGRTSENDICIPSNLVSRHHARLLVGPTGVIVEDAGSTNGCFVNGDQVRHHLMRDGDELELGDLRYRLRTRLQHDPRARAAGVPTLTSVSQKGTTDRGGTVVPLMEKSTGADARTELN
jgi:pSer/pThr/pTyr-binding forkhead associated (FHA) protein